MVCSRAASFDERMKAIVHKINISYCFSVVVPDADAAGLRTVLDWGKFIAQISCCDLLT